MRVTLDAKTLAEALKCAQRGVSNHGKDPERTHTRIVAADDRITIANTDGTIYQEIEVSAQVEQAGTGYYSRALLVRLTGRLRGQITLTESNLAGRYDLDSPQDIEWHEPTPIAAPLQIEGEGLKKALTHLAKSTGDSGTSLDRIYVAPGSGSTRLVASNGHMIVSIERPSTGHQDGYWACILPQVVLAEPVGPTKMGWQQRSNPLGSLVEAPVITFLEAPIKLWAAKSATTGIQRIWTEQDKKDFEIVNRMIDTVTKPRLNPVTVRQKDLWRALDIAEAYNSTPGHHTAIRLSYSPGAGMVAEYNDSETGQFWVPLPTASTSLAPWAGNWDAGKIKKMIGNNPAPITLWHQPVKDDGTALLAWESGGISYGLMGIRMRDGNRNSDLSTSKRAFEVRDGMIILAASRKLLKPARPVIPGPDGVIWLSKAELRAIHQAPGSRTLDMEPERVAA